MTRNPTPEYQLLFLNKLQRLLDEGSFSSTYKYALLISLADLCVEKGSDTDDTLELTCREIAQKFIQLYEHHSLPYPGKKGMLFQNSNNQAKVISRIDFFIKPSKRGHSGSNLHLKNYNKLLSGVTATVRTMPLWKLQRVGTEVDEFLYQNIERGSVITLKPGVMYCFRKFHGLISSIVRGQWVSWISGLGKNARLLGEGKHLEAFLFGEDRCDLKSFVPILRDLQNNFCFYCDKKIKGVPEVDHFIPWSRYPHDQGHNFVLSHKACNSSKSDMLASHDHLANWVQRNHDHNEQLVEYFDENYIKHDLDSSLAVARWAYERAENIESHLWISKKNLTKSSRLWRKVI